MVAELTGDGNGDIQLGVAGSVGIGDAAEFAQGEHAVFDGVDAVEAPLLVGDGLGEFALEGSLGVEGADEVLGEGLVGGAVLAGKDDHAAGEAVAGSIVGGTSGGSFGAGNYAMCGKAYDPRFLFAWPTAKFAVMSGDAAANTLAEIKLKQLEREGKKVDEKAKKELLESIKKSYDHQTDPRYAAARLWLDAIIDPSQTREALIQALDAASLNTRIAEFKTGVLQT